MKDLQTLLKVVVGCSYMYFSRGAFSMPTSQSRHIMVLIAYYGVRIREIDDEGAGDRYIPFLSSLNNVLDKYLMSEYGAEVVY